MRLAIVIPHHRRRELLLRALPALSGQRVIVVDDSPAGGLELGAARVLRSRGEEGFARAANRGLEAAEEEGADLVLLLNDDALPEPGCIERLLSAWGPGVGAVGPLLLRPDGSIESAGFRVRGWGRVHALQELPSGPVEGLSGACLLLSSKERFNTGFAHGMEDLELCHRLRRRGLHCVVVPDARCRHEGGASLSRTSPQAQRHAVAGHLRLMGGGLRTPVVLGLALGQMIREGGPADRISGVWQGWRDWRLRST